MPVLSCGPQDLRSPCGIFFAACGAMRGRESEVPVGLSLASVLVSWGCGGGGEETAYWNDLRTFWTDYNQCKLWHFDQEENWLFWKQLTISVWCCTTLNKADRCQDLSAKGPVTASIKRTTEHSPLCQSLVWKPCSSRRLSRKLPGKMDWVESLLEQKGLCVEPLVCVQLTQVIHLIYSWHPCC